MLVYAGTVLDYGCSSFSLPLGSPPSHSQHQCLSRKIIHIRERAVNVLQLLNWEAGGSPSSF